MGGSVSVANGARAQGTALYQAGNLAGAVRCYRRALAAGNADESHLLHSNLSACLLAAGLFHAALEAADACIAAQPAWAKGHYRRGAVLAALELWPEAIHSLRRAFAHDAQSSTVRDLLSKCEKNRPPAGLRGGGMVFTWGKGV